MYLGHELGYVGDMLHQIEAEDAFQTVTSEGEGSFGVQNDVRPNRQRTVCAPSSWGA